MLEQDSRGIQDAEKQNFPQNHIETSALPYSQQTYRVQTVPLENSKLFAALAYIPMGWIFALLLYPKDTQVKFHANQGIILTLFIAGLYWAISFLSEIFLSFIPLFVVVSTLLNALAGLAGLAYIAIGIAHVYTESLQPLPLIGSLFNFVY